MSGFALAYRDDFRIAPQFIKDFQLDGLQAWIVGNFRKGDVGQPQNFFRQRRWNRDLAVIIINTDCDKGLSSLFPTGEINNLGLKLDFIAALSSLKNGVA